MFNTVEMRKRVIDPIAASLRGNVVLNWVWRDCSLEGEGGRVLGKSSSRAVLWRCSSEGVGGY